MIHNNVSEWHWQEDRPQSALKPLAILSSFFIVHWYLQLQGSVCKRENGTSRNNEESTMKIIDLD